MLTPAHPPPADPPATDTPAAGTLSEGTLSEGPLSEGTLGEALGRLGQVAPHAAFVLPATGERLTARQLDTGADELARGLYAAGVRAGDVVGLLVPTGRWFPLGLFGITRAGAAASVLPVRARRDGRDGTDAPARQLARIADRAAVRHILVDRAYADLAGALTHLRPALRLLDPAELARTAPGARPRPQPWVTADDLALVQFTSGSTGAPKGVCLPHRGLLAGLRAAVGASAMTEHDVYVQWVPHHHDMGLVTPLAYFLSGADVHLFSPLRFLAAPENILRYFADRGGTAFTSPNFGYDILLDAVPADLAASLDLRRWRLAHNGAEPIRAGTVRRFAERFAPAGVPPGVMFPAYGLAEATLAVSAPRPGSTPVVAHVDRHDLAVGRAVRRVGPDDPAAKALVCMGRPVPGMRVRLVDQAGQVCPPERPGEIQIRGEAVTTGYFADPVATAAAFDGPWLRTGDLGCWLDGGLYVVGRRADMVVVNGQNYFPEDVESVAAAVSGVLSGRCVATAGADPDGAEFVAVAVEAAADAAARDRLAARVRSAVVAELGLTAVRVRVLPAGGLPRTTSGKWQRGQVRADTTAHRTALTTLTTERTHHDHDRQPYPARSARPGAQPAARGVRRQRRADH